MAGQSLQRRSLKPSNTGAHRDPTRTGLGLGCLAGGAHVPVRRAGLAGAPSRPRRGHPRHPPDPPTLSLCRAGRPPARRSVQGARHTPAHAMAPGLVGQTIERAGAAPASIAPDRDARPDTRAGLWTSRSCGWPATAASALLGPIGAGDPSNRLRLAGVNASALGSRSRGALRSAMKFGAEGCASRQLTSTAMRSKISSCQKERSAPGYYSIDIEGSMVIARGDLGQ
jgi:hypothetical protein